MFTPLTADTTHCPDCGGTLTRKCRSWCERHEAFYLRVLELREYRDNAEELRRQSMTWDERIEAAETLEEVKEILVEWFRELDASHTPIQPPKGA